MNDFGVIKKQRQDIINELHTDFVFLIRNEWFKSAGIFNSIIGPLSDMLHNLAKPTYEYFDSELAYYSTYLKENRSVLLTNFFPANRQLEMINKYFQKLKG
ncbi:hypothetical protein WOSG25_190020 [Weissella oryzae SG25]|uniref:Uncharacterized protein n=1 Tax=Weissella oryzae (strain DSM 25784 / JCM 18191 / LMG 30913 / SG25) TaxID=1329250 RepID=A0A069CWQ4_WEIOS|nr:hypothetical protein [Weissella oryzae]GAK31894.1 hypothetical protein WOSG25_190020 [Weissella oryzae SG25]